MKLRIGIERIGSGPWSSEEVGRWGGGEGESSKSLRNEKHCQSKIILK